jgi:hypothetical protein
MVTAIPFGDIRTIGSYPTRSEIACRSCSSSGHPATSGECPYSNRALAAA